MKKIIIGALICLNIGLLSVLMFGQTDPAYAQTGYYNETDYVMGTASVELGRDNIYVIDRAAQKIGIWSFDLSRRRLKAMPSRSLATDFRGN